MYSCNSAMSALMSSESFWMLHSSSSLKSKVICLHKRICVMTLLMFDEAAFASGNTRKAKEKQYYYSEKFLVVTMCMHLQETIKNVESILTCTHSYNFIYFPRYTCQKKVIKFFLFSQEIPRFPF